MPDVDIIQMNNGAAIALPTGAAIEYYMPDGTKCTDASVWKNIGTYTAKLTGMTLGDFKVSRFADDAAVTGEDLATQAALKELAGTGYAFCGVR